MGTMKMKAREPITKLVHMQQEPTLPVDLKPAVAIPKKRKTHEMIVGANSPGADAQEGGFRNLANSTMISEVVVQQRRRTSRFQSRVSGPSLGMC